MILILMQKQKTNEFNANAQVKTEEFNQLSQNFLVFEVVN